MCNIRNICKEKKETGIHVNNQTCDLIYVWDFYQQMSNSLIAYIQYPSCSVLCNFIALKREVAFTLMVISVCLHIFGLAGLDRDEIAVTGCQYQVWTLKLTLWICYLYHKYCRTTHNWCKISWGQEKETSFSYLYRWECSKDTFHFFRSIFW